MKKIVNGKRYDTEKAIEIADASARCPRNDFGYWEETLYKTPKSGRFFTAGNGGPMTRYATSYGDNSWGSGSGINILTADEALSWCERHNVDPDVVAEHFKIEDA